MTRQKVLICVLLVGGILQLLAMQPSPSRVSAQDGGDDDACSTLLTNALQVVGSACVEIGQNEACYGHFPITSELQADASGQFESDGDLIAVPQLQSLVTEPANPTTGEWGIALLLVQTESPDTVSQTMTFVLFGDVALNSQGTVASDPATCSITNTSGQNINLRSGPSTNDDIVGALEVDGSAVADAKTENGEWLRIQQDDTTAWVYSPLITTDCNVSALGILDADGAVIPRQSTSAFSLETTPSDTCNALPDGLLVRSPEGHRARVVINGVEMVFSSVGYLTAQADQQLTLSVLEGQVEVTADGQTEIVSSNMLTTVPLSGLTAAGPPTPPQSQSEQVTVVIPALTDANTMLDENSIGTSACTLSTESTVNLRGGPGTNYGLSGQFEADTEMAVTGTALAADGAIWWQLDGDTWVRSDLVSAAGRCDNIPTVEPPAPPPSPPTAAAPVISGRRFVAVDAFGDLSVPLLPIEMGCFEGSAPITAIPAETLGYVTGDPQCNRYPVTFDTGQSGWLLADYIGFLE